jgi:hypothetical protein
VYHSMVSLWLLFQCSCWVSEVIQIQKHMRTHTDTYTYKHTLQPLCLPWVPPP